MLDLMQPVANPDRCHTGALAISMRCLLCSAAADPAAGGKACFATANESVGIKASLGLLRKLSQSTAFETPSCHGVYLPESDPEQLIRLRV
jgi:hypothetical protein